MPRSKGYRLVRILEYAIRFVDVRSAVNTLRIPPFLRTYNLTAHSFDNQHHSAATG